MKQKCFCCSAVGCTVIDNNTDKHVQYRCYLDSSSTFICSKASMLELHLDTAPIDIWFITNASEMLKFMCKIKIKIFNYPCYLQILNLFIHRQDNLVFQISAPFIFIESWCSGCNPKLREASRIFDEQTALSLYKGEPRCQTNSFSKNSERKTVGCVSNPKRREKDHRF